jgi:hypothetical protein
MPRRRHITDIHNSSYSFKGFIFLSDAHSDAETVRNGIQRVDVAPGAVDVGVRALSRAPRGNSTTSAASTSCIAARCVALP